MADNDEDSGFVSVAPVRSSASVVSGEGGEADEDEAEPELDFRGAGAAAVHVVVVAGRLFSSNFAAGWGASTSLFLFATADASAADRERRAISPKTSSRPCSEGLCCGGHERTSADWWGAGTAAAMVILGRALLGDLLGNQQD